MSARRSSLAAALHRYERLGRPGLPVRGYVLERAPGSPTRGIHRLGGGVVLEPDAHIQRMNPAPDRRRIAVEWATRADERGVLALVDTQTGAVRTFRDIRLRYDDVLWSDDSRRLDVVASRDDALVRVDVDSGEHRALPLDAAPRARVRLFPGGRRGILASSVPGRGTELRDRDRDEPLGTWPAVHRVLAMPDTVVVWHARGLDALDASGALRWSWADPEVRIRDLAARGHRLFVLGVRRGVAVVVELVDGLVVDDDVAASLPLDAAAETITAIAVDDDTLFVAVEGPLHPPRVVTAASLPTPRTIAGTTTRLDVPADDGETLTVYVSEPPGPRRPRPMLLACYGGFGVAHLPSFEPTIPAWIDHGGAYATAQIRGGGERGDAWHAAGSGERKQRAVADLADIARGLIAAGATRADLLVLVGSSLGGVIAASCALQHPRLCAGVVATAAPLDLLSLADHPLGSHWRAEFGDDGSAAARRRLRRLSPLELAREATDAAVLPAFLGVVLGEDTRVLARDTHRTAAALRHAGGTARVWTAPAAGHGANALPALHELGLTVLDFADDVTSGAER